MNMLPELLVNIFIEVQDLLIKCSKIMKDIFYVTLFIQDFALDSEFR